MANLPIALLALFFVGCFICKSESGAIFPQNNGPEPRGVCASCPPTAKYCSGKCIKGKCRGECEKRTNKNFEELAIPQEHFYEESSQGCPRLSDLNTTIEHDGEKKYLCSVVYQGPGGKYPINSCNGKSFYIPDGLRVKGVEGFYFPMGSILVKPGCTMYLFKYPNFSGESAKIEAGSVFYNKDFYQNPFLPAGPGSFACTCYQDPIDCTPSDDWETLVVCDNTESPVAADCSYHIRIGSSFSYSVTQTLSLSLTLTRAIAIQFWNIFAAQKTSLTIGFDWSKSYEFSKTIDETIKVNTKVEAGHTLAIQQAVGYCDGSSFRTNMFRIKQEATEGHNINWDDARIIFH